MILPELIESLLSKQIVVVLFLVEQLVILQDLLPVKVLANLLLVWIVEQASQHIDAFLGVLAREYASDFDFVAFIVDMHRVEDATPSLVFRPIVGVRIWQIV